MGGLEALDCNVTKSFISAKILPRMARGLLTQRRKVAKAQRASSDLAASRLGDFALKGLFHHPGSVLWMRLAALQCYPQELRIFGKIFRTVFPKDK